MKIIQENPQNKFKKVIRPKKPETANRLQSQRLKMTWARKKALKNRQVENLRICYFLIVHCFKYSNLLLFVTQMPVLHTSNNLINIQSKTFS